MVRLRFAPSPTGSMHLGLAHTALFNWLYARHSGGAFVLRIEDTDAARRVEGSVETIYDGLRWLDLGWDEGPDVGGPYGPYVQSERLEIYRDHARRLIEGGHAYYCFCSPERLAAMREEQQRRGEVPRYDRRCRDLTEGEQAAHRREGTVPAVRLKVPLQGETTFHDLIRGDVTFNNAVLDDLVLLKSDGYPTYHLANIVDDHLMAITHVMRGEDWISSTPRHILLYRAFGWEPPQFLHLPLIVGPDRAKLSKRHGATSVAEYRGKGYLPEAVRNFLALLGWSPGGDREKLPLEEMIAAFSIEGMTKRAAVFDEQKLEWLNGQYLKETPSERLFDLVAPYFIREGLLADGALERERGRMLRIIGLLKERVRRLPDFAAMGRYFYADPAEYDVEAARKHWKDPETASRLCKLAERLGRLEPFDEGGIEVVIRGLAAELGLSAAKLIHPMRLAVSGVSVGPGLFETMAVLGRETVVRRLRRAAERLS